MIEVGPALAPADVVAVAREGASVALAPEAREAMQRSAQVIARHAGAAEPVYGVTTGFGMLATVPIPPSRREQLQRSLVRSHAAGIGEPVEVETVRAMMLLRVRSLAMGYSGARPAVAQSLLDLLNASITPVVPEFGSVGASGDLAPLAHCALALMGEGEVLTRAGAREPAGRALAAAGLKPVELGPKEGLALINGTDGMLAMLLLALADLRMLLTVADIAAAMSVEALLGTDRVFAADLVALRPQPGQAVSAANLRALLAGSPIVASHREGDPRVQDAYSLRCAPQVLGAARDTVEHAGRVAANELAAAIDNPMILPDGRVESCGNFHGAPPQPIDTWSSCIALVGSEPTLAGAACRRFSATSAACVYWAIISPESTPGSAARNGGSPSERAGSSRRSVRRSAIAPTSAAAIARKSHANASGAPWKLPHDSTRPSGRIIGLLIAAASSLAATRSACSTVSRAAPSTCGAHRNE